MAASGEQCPRCREGRFGVASSQRSGEYQVRYLRCPRCGATDKQTVPATAVARRKFFTIAVS